MTDQHDIDNQIYELGLKHGFGNIMSTASRLWSRDARPVGSEFVVGPCAAEIVDCGCEHSHECDWCCGTGWLTAHVQKIKEAVGV
jgi:hypothetical protein